MAGKSYEQQAKSKAEIAKKKVDIRGIGLYTLGKYRKNLSEKKMEEYNKIFKLYLLFLACSVSLSSQSFFEKVGNSSNKLSLEEVYSHDIKKLLEILQEY